MRLSGRQVIVVVAGNTYFLDLLFYHTHLRAYIVVELKATGFKPEYAGKLNYYLSAVDDLIRKKEISQRLDFSSVDIRIRLMLNMPSEIFTNLLVSLSGNKVGEAVACESPPKFTNCSRN